MQRYFENLFIHKRIEFLLCVSTITFPTHIYFVYCENDKRLVIESGKTNSISDCLSYISNVLIFQHFFELAAIPVRFTSAQQWLRHTSATIRLL